LNSQSPRAIPQSLQLHRAPSRSTARERGDGTARDARVSSTVLRRNATSGHLDYSFNILAKMTIEYAYVHILWSYFDQFP
jgi:hypothetical protein